MEKFNLVDHIDPYEVALAKSSSWQQANSNLTKVKNLMNELGFQQNIDYRISSTKNELKLILPKSNKEYASWIVLNWEKIKGNN